MEHLNTLLLAWIMKHVHVAIDRSFMQAINLNYSNVLSVQFGKRLSVC